MDNRSLGFWETIKTLSHDLFNGSDIVVIDLHLQGHLNIAYFKNALEICFRRHPLLRATIKNEGENYIFDFAGNFNQIPFNVNPSQSDPAQIIVNEMQTLFPKDNYLWRVICLQRQNAFHLIFSFHHAICDAICLFAFLNELLTYYACLEENKEIILKPLKPNPPQEAFLPHETDWQHYLKEATRYQHINDGWNFQTNASLKNRQTKFMLQQLPLDLINRLKKKCQEHHVSLNALLNALALITKAQLEDEEYEGVVWTWANTRQLGDIPVANEHLGYFVNAVATKHVAVNSKKNPWELATDYYRQLKKRLPSLSYYPGRFELAHALAYYNMNYLKATQHFLYDFTLSYLDKLPLEKSYGSLNVVDLNLAVNINSGIAGLVLEIFTFSDYITFVCCYAEPLLNRDWVRSYMQKFQKNIELLA